MGSQVVQRKLTAILAADVVGYSRLLGEDEARTLAQLKTHRKDLVEPKVATYGGRIVKLMGDGMLAEFPSVVDAVQCAIDIQQGMARRNADIPDQWRIEFRIGVNLGDVIIDGDDIYGDGVNVAARLQELAETGGVCISGKVFAEVKTKLDFGYQDLGERIVKNIVEPVGAYRVLTDPEAAGKVLGRQMPRVKGKRWAVLAGILVLASILGVVVVWLRPWVAALEPASEEPTALPQIARPTRHLRVERPADLADADALTIYDRILDDMGAAYRKSGDPSASVYKTWRRYNITPYLSATHGNSYVNNYANPRAKAYGKAENAGTFPEGSVLAKDSFEVTDQGDVFTGPLTLMEKMQPGFNPESRDWRYTMIMADGSLFGTTNGDSSERVEYCAECHLAAGPEQDYLFFVPKAHRRQFLNSEDAAD